MKKRRIATWCAVLPILLLLPLCAFAAAPPSSTNDITSFVLEGVAGEIDSAANEITVVLPWGSDLSSLTPTAIGHNGLSVSPSANTAVDFSVPVVYTVTAEDGGTRQYTVYVSTAPASSECSILQFSLSTSVGTIDHATGKIKVVVPASMNITNIAPTITHNGDSISPLPSEPKNFSTAVTYIVAAQDGTQKTYTVTVETQSGGGGNPGGGNTGAGGNTGGGMTTVQTGISVGSGASMSANVPGASQMNGVPGGSSAVRSLGPSALQRKVAIDGSLGEEGRLTLSISAAKARDAVSRVYGTAENRQKLSAEMEVLFTVDQDNMQSLAIEFEQGALAELYDTRIEYVSFITPLFTITLNHRAIFELRQYAGEAFTLVATPIGLGDSVSLIGARPAFAFWLEGTGEDGEKQGISLLQGKITIDIAYTPAEGENAKALCAVDATEEGAPSIISNSYYAGGSVHLTLSNVGIVAVGNKEDG